MITDIKLKDDGAVGVEANDLELDGGSDRGHIDGNPRRALVHDWGDKLTLNYRGDYTGGVTIWSDMEIIGSIVIPKEEDPRALHVEANDLELDGGSDRGHINDNPRRRALVHDWGDKLTLNYRGDYTGGVTIWSDTDIISNKNPAVLRIQSRGGFGASRVEFWSDRGTPSEWRPGFIESTDELGGHYKGGLRVCVNGEEEANKTGEIEIMRFTDDGVKVNRVLEVFNLNGKPLSLVEGRKAIQIGAGDVLLIDPDGGDMLGGTNIALSHMDGDVLVINRKGGFRGGVRVEGDLNLAKNLAVTGEARVEGALTAKNLNLDVGGKLLVWKKVEGGGSGGPSGPVPAPLPAFPVDLVELVNKLEKRVAELEDWKKTHST